VWPTWHLLALPFFTLLALIASTGAGLWLAALNVEYRDFRYVVPFFVQLGLYVSPVGFSSSLVRDKLGETVFVLYSLNPVVGVVDGFRWAISGGRSPIFLPGLIASFVVMSLLLVSGVWYFRRMERTFADVI
jgi:lipopolysaccharide transport system permease protein